MVGRALVVALELALVSVGFVKHEERIREQNMLSGIASELAGRRVGVRCPSFVGGLVDTHGEEGRVTFDENGRPANHTDLSPEACDQLRNFSHVDFTCLDRGTCGYSEFQAAWAAHTLAHEAFHLRGYEDEGVTECYALQDTAFVAQHLGLDPRHAGELQEWIFTKGYPNEPSEYHSAQCYSGGPLDLQPADPAWP